MINIYDPDNFKLPKRRDSLQECLENLQQSMFNELNGWEEEWKNLSAVPDVKEVSFSRKSYKQKLEEYHKIYPDADWVLIFGWFNNFEKCYHKDIKLRGIINDMPIKEVVKSLKA